MIRKIVLLFSILILTGCQSKAVQNAGKFAETYNISPTTGLSFDGTDPDIPDAQFAVTTLTAVPDTTWAYVQPDTAPALYCEKSGKYMQVCRNRTQSLSNLVYSSSNQAIVVRWDNAKQAAVIEEFNLNSSAEKAINTYPLDPGTAKQITTALGSTMTVYWNGGLYAWFDPEPAQ